MSCWLELPVYILDEEGDLVSRLTGKNDKPSTTGLHWINMDTVGTMYSDSEDPNDTVATYVGDDTSFQIAMPLNAILILMVSMGQFMLASKGGNKYVMLETEDLEDEKESSNELDSN